MNRLGVDNLFVGQAHKKLWPHAKHCLETLSVWMARSKLFLLHSFKERQPETD